MPLILASASPRRRELLAAAGLEFEVEVSRVDETPSAGLEPEAVALEIATRKAWAVAERHFGEDVHVLGADTVVALGDSGVGAQALLLGKPHDAREAREMLASLSGTRHRVITGVCVLRPSPAAEATAWERTWVDMRVITEAEIEAYVASGEWRDKAGGYAIQETADAFVRGLEEGGFDNVVGLPVELALRLLREVGWRPVP
jgi:septum formation protein